MCNRKTLETEAASRQSLAISRRDFTLAGFSAAAVALLPTSAHAMQTEGSMVSVSTPDGVADCFLARPTSGTHPGVILWPDFMSLRHAYEQLAHSLASEGYAVLAVNQYYRQAKSPIVQKVDFKDKDTMGRVSKLLEALQESQVASDAKSFVSYLDAQAFVDKKRKIGTMGYCLGGGFAFETAIAVPERVGAIASFHASGLVSKNPDSVHLRVPRTRAQALIAIAEDDDKREPEAKSVLQQAYADARLPAEIAVYPGTVHGWCTPDMTAYFNPKQAQAAWGRLLALLDRALV